MPRPRTWSRRAALLLPLAGCSTGDRGIGGTGGIADRGIGGTGISGGFLGTITGFGSIWVNGRRIDLPEATPVTLEGEPVPLAALRLGQMAAVLARRGADGGWSAERVDLRYVVAGPVQRVEPDALVVLDQRIALAGLASAARQPGQWVAVAGLRQPDGQILASRIDPWPAARGWLLRGTCEAVAAGRATIAGAVVALPPGQPAPTPGAALRLTGELGAGGPRATALAPDPVNPFGAGIGLLSVETYLDASGRGPGGLGGGRPGARVVYEAAIGGPGGGLGPGRTAPAPWSAAGPAPRSGGADAPGMPGAGFQPGPGGGQGTGGRSMGGPGLGGPGLGGPGMGPGAGPPPGAGGGGRR